MWALGMTAALGLVSVGAIMAWKRRQARRFYEEGGTLPEPGKFDPQSLFQPFYRVLTSMADPVPHPTLPGRAAYLTRQGRFSRSFVMDRDPPHWGLDITAPIGTVVYAAKAGRVIRVGRRVGYGNVVEISHGDGESTVYAHLNQYIVDQGETVTGGQPIGEVGRTSADEAALMPEWGLVMPSHLHFEVHQTDPPMFGRQNPRIEPTRWLQQNDIAMYGERAARPV